MRREFHVRFCEGLGVRSPRATRLVVLCQDQSKAQAAMRLVQEWTETNGLTLHPDKTHVGNCTVKGQGFEFLGYRFEAGRRYVRKKSLKALREKVRQKTKRTRGDSIECVITSLNPILCGWFEYFKHAHQTTFRGIDGFVRRRLRSIRRRQNKKQHGTGSCLNDHLSWPNAYFTERGLFTMHEARLALVSQPR